MDPPNETHEQTQNEVGLANPKAAMNRRKMLDAANNLHNIGLAVDTDLPVIAVIGQQSAGKSSLVESMSGITLPRKAGTCTRVPTECRLIWSDSDWSCQVNLRFIKDKDGQSFAPANVVPFGPTITDKREIQERIARAQRAVLNPSKDPSTFLQGPDEDPATSELNFSSNPISLRISGRDVADLSFVDLPGLISSVGDSGDRSQIEIVRSLVVEYVKNPSCLILLTVACETDFNNQAAHQLATDHDPEGARTIGVLTKPDKIDAGDEDNWTDLIRGKGSKSDTKWFVVKQPNSQDISLGIDWYTARQREQTFFSTSTCWSALAKDYSKYLGTVNLTAFLSAKLTNLIAERLPEIERVIHRELENVEGKIKGLPKKPSDSPQLEIMDLITTFVQKVKLEIDGRPGEDALIQQIRHHQDNFALIVKNLGPHFVPWTRTEQDARHESPVIEGLDDDTDSQENPQQYIFLEVIRGRILAARSRELPGCSPFSVIKSLIEDSTNRWPKPMNDYLESTFKVMHMYVDGIIDSHFSSVGRGILLRKIKKLTLDELRQLRSRCQNELDLQVGSNKDPYTNNLHYLEDYQSKSYARLRKAAIKFYRSEDSDDLFDDHQKILSDTFANLRRLGFNVKEEDDLFVLPTIEGKVSAEELKVMAHVHAYYQVAYKRIIDGVPQLVDTTLIRAFATNLQRALLNGLEVSGAEGVTVCKDLLREPDTVAEQREELERKLTRLNSGGAALKDLYI